MEQQAAQQIKVWIKSENSLLEDAKLNIDECVTSDTVFGTLKIEPKTNIECSLAINFTDFGMEKQNPEISGKVYENGKINRIQCPKCDHTFKNRANLKNHLKYVHSSKDDFVECGQCFKTFKTIAHLRSHTNSVHAEEKLIKCQLCDKTFLNKKRLDNHIFYSHPKSEDNVTCDICKKEFKQKYSLKVHIRQVHPSETRSVKCPHCNKLFKVDMLLQRHIKWSHPTDGMLYPCQECGRVMPSIAGYKKHLENVHSKEHHECDVCFKTFKSHKTLVRHMKTIHKGNKSDSDENVGHLPCSECGKKFSTNSVLSFHFERHHVNGNGNVCHICTEEFSDYGSFKRHLKTVHCIENATCYICDKSFKSAVHLQRHIRVTHAPPEAAQTCSLCHKTFKCSMHLRIHINAVHSSDGSFQCDVCEKEFASKKYMLKHRKIHVDSKKFPCLICGKYYKCIADVNKHMKRVHVKGVMSNNSVLLKCGLCGADCASNATLTEHTKSCSTREPILRYCPKCDAQFGSDETLHKHILLCGGDISESSEQIPLGIVKSEIE